MSATTDWIFLKFGKLVALNTHSMENDLKIQKNAISQQPLVGSSSVFKLKPRRPNQHLILLLMKTTSNERHPQILKLRVPNKN